MICTNCGKEIQDGSAFCSECGATQQAGAMPPPVSNAVSYAVPTKQSNANNIPTNTLCIIGLVISAISLFLSFFGIVGIAGTIVSVLGLQSCKQRKEKGKALAIMGIVFGVFSILAAFIALVSLLEIFSDVL